MSCGVSVFSEGIILDDYCYTSDVLTLTLQNVFYKNVLCSANCVAPLGLFFNPLLGGSLGGANDTASGS
jgi:hypothetical protein